MKTVKLVLRLLLGAGMIMFGLNKYLHFMDMPPMDPAMGEWMGAIGKTGFMFPIAGAVQIITGLAFLLNKFVQLALIILLPVMLIAFLSHLFLDIAGIPGSAVFLALIIFQMVSHKESYKELFKA